MVFKFSVLAPKLKSKPLKTWKSFQDINFKGFVLFEDFENFQVFWFFDFIVRAKIKNSEILVFPNFSLLKKIHSNLEVLKKFPSFPSFDFSISDKIENSETSETSNFPK